MDNGDHINALVRPQPGGQGVGGQPQNPMASLVQGGGMPGGMLGMGRPTPSHEQTVSALYHFHELQRVLQDVLATPGIGKDNVRPRVFDAAAELLANGMMSLPQLMSEIKGMPTEPVEQKKWLQTHLANVIAAQKQVLSDHAAGATPDMPRQMPNPDQHQEHMSALRGHYGSS